jgi:hypothetical protein
MSEKQTGLERDVSEQAGALTELAREVELGSPQTAGKLEAAAAEMKAGAAGLSRASLNEGLDHGQKALALLKEAEEKFGEERQAMSGAAGAAGSMRAALLLQQILVRQKKVLRGTEEADATPRTDASAARKTAGLAGEQSAVRVATSRLERMVGQSPIAELLRTAGEKMNVSRIALESADTGKETRVVQREAIALLEQLAGGQKGGMSGMGLAGMRTLAMMQLLAQIGQSPGGYAGGGNAPILPATVSRVADEGWRKVRSRFDEKLGADFEAQYPPEFRPLLDAYFAKLRSEPPR